jgi:hypothetical protein
MKTSFATRGLIVEHHLRNGSLELESEYWKVLPHEGRSVTLESTHSIRLGIAGSGRKKKSTTPLSSFSFSEHANDVRRKASEISGDKKFAEPANCHTLHREGALLFSEFGFQNVFLSAANKFAGSPHRCN